MKKTTIIILCLFALTAVVMAGDAIIKPIDKVTNTFSPQDLAILQQKGWNAMNVSALRDCGMEWCFTVAKNSTSGYVKIYTLSIPKTYYQQYNVTVGKKVITKTRRIEYKNETLQQMQIEQVNKIQPMIIRSEKTKMVNKTSVLNPIDVTARST